MWHFLFPIFICSSWAVEFGTSPESVKPGTTIKYPHDYCEYIDDDEYWDFVVIGGGKEVVEIKNRAKRWVGMEEEDYKVICGGGYGGSIVARRLAEIPNWKILLLEAGDDPPVETDLPGNVDSLPDEIKFQYFSKKSDKYCLGMDREECVYTSAKVLGGGSTINRMLYERGTPFDQNEWESKKGCKGWNYKECLPYFKKLENYKVLTDLDFEEDQDFDTYHGKEGPITISNFPVDESTGPFFESLVDTIKDLGYNFVNDLTRKKYLGFTESPGMVDNIGYRQNTAKTYLLNIPDNLKVCKNSYVKKINFVKKRAISVEYIYREKFHKKAQILKEVIISAGALGSPLILERSGVGNKDILDNIGISVVQNLPGVGENLQDHFIVKGFAYKMNIPEVPAPNSNSIRITSLTGWLDTTKTQSIPDIKVLPIIYTSESNFKFSIFDSYEIASIEKPLLIFSPILLRQFLTGSVHINTENPHANPEIIPNQFTDKSEIRTLIKAMKSAMEIIEHPSLEKFQPEFVNIPPCKFLGDYKSSEVLECLIRYTADSLYDYAGTCAMGSIKDSSTVVDVNLRVLGIDNVRVIDASIMPLIPRSGTAIPTAMVAEKGADIIKHYFNKTKYNYDRY